MFWYNKILVEFDLVQHQISFAGSSDVRLSFASPNIICLGKTNLMLDLVSSSRCLMLVTPYTTWQFHSYTLRPYPLVDSACNNMFCSTFLHCFLLFLYNPFSETFVSCVSHHRKPIEIWGEMFCLSKTEIMCYFATHLNIKEIAPRLYFLDY